MKQSQCILTDCQILTQFNAAAFHGFKSFTIFMIWPRSIYQALLLSMVHLEKSKEEEKRSIPILSMTFIKLFSFWRVNLGGSSAFCPMRMKRSVCVIIKKFEIELKAQYKVYESGKIMHNSAEQRLCIWKIDDLTPFITRSWQRLWILKVDDDPNTLKTLLIIGYVSYKIDGDGTPLMKIPGKG